MSPLWIDRCPPPALFHTAPTQTRNSQLLSTTKTTNFTPLGLHRPLVGPQEGHWACRKTHCCIPKLFPTDTYEERGTGIRGLMRGMATLPQGNQELSVVRDKVGRPPGELGVRKSMECDIFPSVLWHCWLGDRKGIRPVKKLDVGFVGSDDLTGALHDSSSPVVTTTSIILCFNKHRLTQVHLENGR